MDRMYAKVGRPLRGLGFALLVLVFLGVTAFAQNPRMKAQTIGQQGQRRNQFPGGRQGTGGLGRQGGLPKLNPAQRQQLQKRLMQAIGLTPEQHQRIQQIRLDHEEERISAGRRLRQARGALDRAIMAENYNETAVQRATDELAAAQADKVRLEARIRGQIRNVLTPDQINRFHDLERELRREMRQQNAQEPPREQQLDEMDLLNLPDQG